MKTVEINNMEVSISSHAGVTFIRGEQEGECRDISFSEAMEALALAGMESRDIYRSGWKEMGSQHSGYGYWTDDPEREVQEDRR